VSRAGGLSSAAFVTAEGWRVGTLIRGGPIVYQGEQIERPRLVRITAIGERCVLGRTLIDGETRWYSEMSLGFDSRDWTLAELPTPASHPPPPATGADNRTTTHTTPETGAGDEGESDE
jgi:hypothetical protein